MKLVTAPSSKIGDYWLFLALPNWARFAEELERILQIPYDSQLVIQWDLVYNWAPDDDPECECTPQYQPTLFGKVSIVDSSTLWEKSRCPLVVEFDHEDWVVRDLNNSITAGLDMPVRVAESLVLKHGW